VRLGVWWIAPLLPAHGHGVDGVTKLFEGDGFGGAEFFAAVLAEEEDGEVGGGDAEAAASGGGVLGCEAGVGGRGVVEGDGDEEDVALVEAGGVVFEFVELGLEGGVVGGWGEEQEGAEGVAELGKGRGGGWGLGGGGEGHKESSGDGG